MRRLTAPKSCVGDGLYCVGGRPVLRGGMACIVAVAGIVIGIAIGIVSRFGEI